MVPQKEDAMFRPIHQGEKYTSQGLNEDYSLIEHLARSIYFGDDWGQMIIVMLSSYYDSSAYTIGPHILVVAGYMSRVEIWKDFEREWKDHLALPQYNVPYFHMKEFTVSQGAFAKGWKGEHQKRREFLQGLIEIIQRNTLASFAFAVRVNEYESLLAADFTDMPLDCPLRSPFAYCGWMCVQKSRDYALSEGYRFPKIESYFEDGEKDEQFLRAMLKWAKFPVPGFKPKIPRCPADELDILTPLQAADFAAWEGMKITRSVDENPDFDWSDVRESFKQLAKYPPSYWNLIETWAIKKHFESMLKYQTL
jgi:hypothetical protein